MPAGYTIRNVEPFELRGAPEPVRLLFYSWIVDLGLKAKDRELAAGLDAFGDPLRPITAKTRKYRKSAMGPASPNAPPLTPARKLSRTRSLLAGKAYPDRAEFWWRFDAFTGDVWSKILTYHQEKGRDVFGLSPDSLERVRLEAIGRYRKWLKSGAAVPAQLQGVKAASPALMQPSGPVPFTAPGNRSMQGITSGIGGGPSAAAQRSGNWSGWLTEAELKAYATAKAPAAVQSRPAQTYNRLLSHVWGMPKPSGGSPIAPLAPKPSRPPVPKWTPQRGLFDLPRRNPMPPTPAEPIPGYLPSDEKIAKAKPKAKAPAVAFPKATERLETVRPLGGSTGAKLVKDQAGNLYVHKSGSNPGHLRNEVHADAIYKAIGVDVAESRLYEESGKAYKLARFADGKTLGELERTDPAAYAAAKAKLREHFVADALLGNWDVIGASSDNILVTPDGRVLRIDNGGSLRYRARGALKSPSQWNGTVSELDSLRDPAVNPAAAKVFGGIADDEIRAQIKAIVRRRAAILRAAPDDVREVLGQRLDYIKTWATPANPVDVGNWKPTPADQFRAITDLHKFEEDHYRDWRQGLAADEKAAVRYYTASGYREWNKWLRNQRATRPDDVTPHVQEALDRALARGALKEGIVVHRGFVLRTAFADPEWVKRGIKDRKDLVPGMDLIDKGYTSTSPATGSAWHGEHLEIRVPAGTPGAYVAAASSHSHENEFLLGRGVDTFRIIEVRSDRIVVEALQSSELEKVGKKGRKGH